MPEALDDLAHWVRTEPRIAARAIDLIEAALRDPFGGIGKPEPLKFRSDKVWSRRITREHRLVYRATDTEIIVLACRFHYDRC